MSVGRMIVIAGPTASGKTAAAVETALALNGEVISADSMQIYKYMDIGTAKPTPAEMKGIRHHLISELPPDEPYSAAIFCRMAETRLEEIAGRGKVPILCGGTGFYINALLFGGFAEKVGEGWVDDGYREALYARARANGAESLHGSLASVDPPSAEVIHPNNIKRVVRALEYIHQTGERFSEHNAARRLRPMARDADIFILDMRRDLLYNKTNARVDAMLEAGLAEEVRGLLDMGYGENLVSMQGLGYKELVPYVRGHCTLEDAAEQLKTATRHYAKRQITWFLNQNLRKSVGERVDADRACEIIIGRHRQCDNI